MASVEIKNRWFGPIQITLASPGGKLQTLVLGARETIVVDEDRVTADIHRKHKQLKLDLNAAETEEDGTLPVL